MPAAIAIPLLISAGTSVAQGVMASKAAKKAAKQQTEASKVGLEQVAQPVYQEQRQLWNPYVQVGRGALGNLSALTGIQGPGPAEPRPNYGPGGPNATQGQPLGQMMAQTQQAQPRSPLLQQGQMVSLRAPNGQVQSVPFDQAQHYINMGAQRVG